MIRDDRAAFRGNEATVVDSGSAARGDNFADMAQPSDPSDRMADELWAHLRRTQPQFALHAGEPVTQLPRGTHEEASKAAALGRRLLAELDRLSDADTSTAAVVRELAGQLAGGDDDYWWSFPVAPYQTYVWTMAGQQVFRPFTSATGDDAQRYLSLVSDFTHSIKAVRTKLVGQAERGIELPRPALPGFLATVRAHRAAALEFRRPAESRLAGLDAAARGALVEGVARRSTCASSTRSCSATARFRSPPSSAMWTPT